MKKNYFLLSLGFVLGCSQKKEEASRPPSPPVEELAPPTPPKPQVVYLNPDQISFKALKPLYKILSEQVIKTRDSGAPITADFLNACVPASTPTYILIDCNDLTFPHLASAFPGKNGETFLLITEDGASVENRWVFKVQGEKYVDVTQTAWPELSYKQLAELYAKAGFKNPNYTEAGLKALAHSSYRITHPQNGETTVELMEAYPEQGDAKSFGKLHWNGQSFTL
jgi:hypothetical protein